VDPSLLCFSQQINTTVSGRISSLHQKTLLKLHAQKNHIKSSKDRLQLPSITGLSQRRLSTHSFLHICTKRKKERKKAAPLHLSLSLTPKHFSINSLFLRAAAGSDSTADSFLENNQRKQKLENTLT
jgi:hypothetical protein